MKRVSGIEERPSLLRKTKMGLADWGKAKRARFGCGTKKETGEKGGERQSRGKSEKPPPGDD